MPDAHRVTTWKALLDLFASTDQIAALVGVSYTVVVEWHRSGRVPPEFWDRLRLAARDAGVRGVSNALMARLPSAKGVQTIRDLIDLWPSLAALARDVGLRHATVSSWQIRNSIPVEHWGGVIASARSYGIGHLTETRLRAIATARKAGRQSVCRQTYPKSTASFGFGASEVVHFERHDTNHNDFSLGMNFR